VNGRNYPISFVGVGAADATGGCGVEATYQMYYDGDSTLYGQAIATETGASYGARWTSGYPTWNIGGGLIDLTNINGITYTALQAQIPNGSIGFGFAPANIPGGLDQIASYRFSNAAGVFLGQAVGINGATYGCQLVSGSPTWNGLSPDVFNRSQYPSLTDFNFTNPAMPPLNTAYTMWNANPTTTGGFGEAGRCTIVRYITGSTPYLVAFATGLSGTNYTTAWTSGTPTWAAGLTNLGQITSFAYTSLQPKLPATGRIGIG
jgi:hypothetical protein